MSLIILDMGSGNTCKNDLSVIMQMIDEVPRSRRHEIILKWQLFKGAEENIPLSHTSFNFAYEYAEMQGFRTTASVFDAESLDFLVKHYYIPFIKFANDPSLRNLMYVVPRNIPIYASYDGQDWKDPIKPDVLMCCVSDYPATLERYYTKFSIDDLSGAVSDHTVGTKLFRHYQPQIWEKHYKLKDSTGLDAGEFAITPEELEGVL